MITFSLECRRIEVDDALGLFKKVTLYDVDPVSVRTHTDELIGLVAEMDKSVLSERLGLIAKE